MSNIIPQNKFYVYQLRLETSEEPFYIGKGKAGRISAHFTSSQLKKKSYKNNILNKAIKDGVQIIITKLHENITEQEAFDLEMHYIAMYGRIDLGTGILANHTDGGEGMSGYVPTKETKLKLSMSNVGQKRSEETKINISNSKKGKTIGHENHFSGKRHTEATKKIMKTKNYIKRLFSWEHPSVTEVSLTTVWKQADLLYCLYIAGHKTKNKLAIETKISPNNLSTIVNKFKSGWIPLLDNNWCSKFI